MNFEKSPTKKIHPRDEASTLSRLCFWYMLPLFIKGARKDLQEEDLYHVPENYEASSLLKNTTAKWETSKDRKFPLLNLLWMSHGPYYLITCFSKFFVKTAIIFFQPFAYSKIIAYFVPNQTSISRTYVQILSIALILSKIFYAIFERNIDLRLTILGIKIKASLYALIYQKLLKIHYMMHPEMGRIITLLTKDLQTLAKFFLQGAFFLESVIITVVVCVILYLKIGLASLPLILVVIFMLPLHGFILDKIKHYEKRMCENAEKRYKILKESFQYIRLIKMYTWESIFEKRVTYYRRKEISAMFKIIFLTFLTFTTTLVILNGTLYLNLILYMYLDNQLTAEIIFYLLNCYRILFDNYGSRLVLSYTELGKLLACLKRIENTLTAAEIITPRIEKCTSALIEAKNLNISTSDKNILQQINFKIEQPLMVILQGTSGKTVLLKTLSGEYYTDGFLSVKGQVSYTSQEPWLFPGTIRQNILFGEDYDEKRYQKVLEVCQLSDDFGGMQNHDLTVVDDVGLNLSKGQCARISLARAVYRKADIYLIDDCFTSVDSKIRSEIFKECFYKFLNGRVRVIVTQESYVDLIHQVYSLENNSLNISKSRELSEVAISEPYKQHLGIEPVHDLEEVAALLPRAAKEVNAYSEGNEKGSVTKNVYLKYFSYGGTYLHYGLLFLVTTSTQVLLSSYDVLLPKWADFRDEYINRLSQNDTNLEQYKDQANTKFIICVLIMVFAIALGNIRYLMTWYFTKKIVLNLHKNALKVLYFPITYFESRRVGNILNKFSKDFTIIDEYLSLAWICTFALFPTLIGVLVMISFTKPLLLIIYIIFAFSFIFVQIVYLRTSRNLRRLDSLTRAPLIGYIKSTFKGITTIRAAHNQQKLTEQFHKFQNIFTSTTYTLECGFSTFWFALDLLCVIFNTVLLIHFIVFDDGTNTAGDVGFVLFQASFLQIFLSLALHFLAQIENLMTSVERVLEYTENKNENQAGIEMDYHWPETGNIDFKNIILKYPTSNNMILNDFNLSVEGGEKVLIVGRTGTGKSSIFSVLFRLYDFDGVITIDGVDIKTLCLKYLRSKLSIVSQDIVLFSGSIRDNIDAGKQCSDEELWGIIKLLKLGDVVGSLDDKINKNDDKFSYGQKQLLSLARAMVQKNKILLLDEPFSNLDLQNVELVENILVKRFMKCTVIMISHVIPSIWKCNKIVNLQGWKNNAIFPTHLPSVGESNQ